MLYLSENCPSERRFNVVAKSTHHSPTNAVKYYLTHEYDQYRPITPPTPFQGDSVTNAETYYVLPHYTTIKSALLCPPPPFEGGGGNLYTTSIIHFWSCSFLLLVSSPFEMLISRHQTTCSEYRFQSNDGGPALGAAWSDSSVVRHTGAAMLFRIFGAENVACPSFNFGFEGMVDSLVKE